VTLDGEKKMRSFLSDLPGLLKKTYQEWKEDGASRLSAALAYYTIFSLAPLLVIVITVVGLIAQADVARAQILSQVRGLMGPQGADFVATLISNRGQPAQGIVALVIGIVTLVLGALGVFNELHTSLNTVWEVKVEQPQGFLQSIKKLLIDRFLSFAMILVIGFLLLVSLVITAGLSAAQQTIGSAFPFSELLWQIVNLAVSLVVITVLFALIFKFLPDAEIDWHDVWVGAFFTALLFSLGKAAIGIYLGNSSVASIFGAAGSLVLLLLWIYYSAQILFFGAEFTQVYASRYGTKNASGWKEPAPKPEVERSKVPAALAIRSRERQVERHNRQTGRVLLGIVITSYLTGILTMIFGLKKR
jgi:membrane protein